MDKKLIRKRRACSSRMKIRELEVVRLTVNRTPRHIYAQLIVPAPMGDKVLASASTLDIDLKKTEKVNGNISSAIQVGKMIASRALAIGITKVAFDRSGFKYHGCVKAIADAARAGGLCF